MSRDRVAGRGLAGATAGTGQTDTGTKSGRIATVQSCRAGISRGDTRDRTDRHWNQKRIYSEERALSQWFVCVGERPNVQYYGTLVLRVFLWTSDRLIIVALAYWHSMTSVAVACGPESKRRRDQRSSPETATHQCRWSELSPSIPYLPVLTC